MPANHVALLGQQKKMLEGYSQSSTLPHTGFIYYSDLVQKLPAVSDTTYFISNNIPAPPCCYNYNYNDNEYGDNKPAIAEPCIH
jgi:hypothetical protein